MLMVMLAGMASAQERIAPSADVDVAIARGLNFLVKDALAWKAEHDCVSCHHAALVVWAFREAKQHGRAVDEPFLAEFTKWLAESGDGKTSIPRPEGIPMALNVKAVWFALALDADRTPDEISWKGLTLLTQTVKSDQTENGSWAAWPDTRPPIFGKSNDSATALATLALLSSAARDDEAKAARDRAVKWLAETPSDDDPQSVAMRLVLWRRLDRPAADCNSLLRRIMERQNADGGWSQAADMASDAWATGQALYALSPAQPANEIAVARGQAFLVKTQRADGSWPMTSRPISPDRPGSTSLIPITGAGSAWAVLGLVRSAGTKE